MKIIPLFLLAFLWRISSWERLRLLGLVNIGALNNSSPFTIACSVQWAVSVDLRVIS
jgi:hypothetical protein